MEKTITLSELKPGDIILYSTHKTKISILISILTLSKVSHTGIVDYNHAFSLQEVDKGAMRNPLPDAGTRKLYIRRLQDAPDTDVVVDIARKYVDMNLPYTNVNLIALGLYMLACDFIPDTFEGEIISNLLKIATYEIIKYFNNIYHPDLDVPPMVCSQFAAACYDEATLSCGPEYKIHYKENVTTVYTLLKKIIDQLREDENKKYVIKENAYKHFLCSTEAKLEGGEAAEQFCDKFINHQEDKKCEKNKDSRISDELITDFYQYGKWLLKFMNHSNSNIKCNSNNNINNNENIIDINTIINIKDEVTGSEIKEVLEELMRFQEVFVTPQDLLANTTNLVDMGVLTYTQDELEDYKKKVTDEI